MWTKQEQVLRINALELLGAKLGLFSFFKDNKDIKHIRVMMDNNTAVAYINNMGGISSDLFDDIAFDIWQWVAERLGSFYFRSPRLPMVTIPDFAEI